jgi:hypothetical protein
MNKRERDVSVCRLGVIGMIWSVYWWYFSYERPAIHPTITEAERIYIEESIGESCSISNKVSSLLRVVSFAQRMENLFYLDVDQTALAFVLHVETGLGDHRGELLSFLVILSADQFASRILSRSFGLQRWQSNRFSFSLSHLEVQISRRIRFSLHCLI